MAYVDSNGQVLNAQYLETAGDAS